jgi:adenylate cyclase
MERRLAAILAADVSGYSRLMGNDEAGTLAALKALRADLVDPKVAEYKGRIFKSTGDGLLAEFPSVVNAVACAVDIQRGTDRRNADLPEKTIALRIGVNLGDVIVEGDDVFGDGVNIAVRLEGLASPGSVVVSAMVRENIGNRLALKFDDMGEQELKNIDRPIRTFRVIVTEGQSPSLPAREQVETLLSVAVLPFDNMSGIPEQTHIGEGIAENIITDLSRFRDLTVIARNSSFSYQGRATRVQDIRRELNVNYILEGSVQRVGERMRITAQLIEGATGKHLWAERYDRHVDDLFAVMDEVTELIVGTLGTTYGGRLRKAASERATRSGPKSFRAFDHFLRGMEDLNRFTKDSVPRSIEHFRNAVSLEPQYAKAHAKIAWGHLSNLWLGWSSDEAASFKAACDAADAAVRSDDAEAWAYWAVAGCAIYSRQYDRALTDMKRALELNPNDADVLTDMGLFCTWSGQAEEALTFALKAMRINPHYPEYYAAQLGQIYFDARQYDNAIKTIEAVRTLDTPLMRIYLAASYAALGQEEAARATVARLIASEPQSTLSHWTSPKLAPYRKDSDREHLAGNLRKAGLPE